MFVLWETILEKRKVVPYQTGIKQCDLHQCHLQTYGHLLHNPELSHTNGFLATLQDGKQGMQIQNIRYVHRHHILDYIDFEFLETHNRKISTCAKENPILKIPPCRKVTFPNKLWPSATHDVWK